MMTRKPQRGMSLMMMLFVLIVLAVFGMAGLKLLPVYLESFKVQKALQGTIEAPNVQDQTKREIAFSIVRRLDIDGSYLIKESNWKDYLEINKKPDRVTVKANWRQEVELFGNLSLVASFSKEVSNRP